MIDTIKAKSAFTLAEVLITLVIIGVVAALTIPVAISKYKKTEVETRLKKSFSTLSNAVKRATADHGDVSTWEFSDFDNFLDKYFLPYIRNSKGTCRSNQIWGGSASLPSCVLYLADGTKWTIMRLKTVPPYFYEVRADINGEKKPNKIGYDIFLLYIFPSAAEKYNFGDGDMAHHVPNSGVYYDGYGIANNTLNSSVYRGCYESCSGNGYCRSYCTALIANNGWKIPDDYPIKI